MLQQTQVGTVIPYFEKFIQAFPRLSDLAAASEEEVLRLWSGLGYYSRARNLHRGAQYILENHDGIIPQTREELLKVPGIGPYTAGAILSIAFGFREPLVDGNVERVFSRLFGWDKPVDSKKAKDFFWEKAEELVSLSTNPKFFNQALMELGSLICTKSSPRCEFCPAKKSCIAFQSGNTLNWPFKKKKVSYQNVTLIKYFIEHQGKFLLNINTENKWWKGLWDVPTEHLTIAGACKDARKSQDSQSWKTRASARAAKLKAISWKECNHYSHTVTHHKLTVVPIHIRLKESPKLPGKWFKKNQVQTLGTSALVRKIVIQEL